MSDDLPLDPRDVNERRTLQLVLGVNLAQSLVIGAVGLYANSTGLLGSAFDNLSDAGVYALGIYAVGRTDHAKARVALVSGIVLVVIGLALLSEVGRRFYQGAEPIGWLMIIAAGLSVAANVVCLKLLRAHRRDGVHLQASWQFTTNDTIVNGGIALSGLLVMATGSSWPDLIIGIGVAALVVHGGWEIIETARKAEAE